MTDTPLLPPDSPELLAHIRGFQHSAFRLETLQVYGNSGEDDALAAFRSGAPMPRTAEDEEWEAMIRGHVQAGRVMQRVHVVTEPLTDYTRFELTWAYAPSVAAGEDIRIIPVPEGWEWPMEMPPEGQDFWLFDDRVLFLQEYDPVGNWLGSYPEVEAGCIALAREWRDIALRQAIPWTEYVHARSDLIRHLPVLTP